MERTYKPFITEPGAYSDIAENAYHADPVIGGSLSSTGAKHLVKSPAHYRHYADIGMAPRAAFDRGHVIHKEILGEGADIAVMDFDSWRSKAAQEDRDAARADGRVPILDKDFLPLLEVANTVLDDPVVGPWFTGEGDSEVSIFHKNPEFGVWMRGRVDRVIKDGDTTVLIDVKTTQDADPALFGRTAAKFGYDLQMAWYTHIWEALHPDQTIRFLHVLVGLDEPTTLSVVELDDDFNWTGTELMNRALERYAECTKTNTWPGYPTTTTRVAPPAYHLHALEDLEEMEL